MRRNKIMKKKKAFPKMQIPGEILQKHIKYGEPIINGLYMVYYKHWPPSAHDHIPMAGMEIVTWSDGTWYGNKQILAWIGPLPVLSLDELTSEKQETVATSFVTASMKQMAQYKYATGPHYQYVIAVLRIGMKGEFVFEMNTHRSIPFPLAKYNTKTRKWNTLKKPQQKKYLKILKIYLKKEMKNG